MSGQGVATDMAAGALGGVEAERLLVNAARCHAQVDLTRSSDGTSMPGTFDRTTDTTIEVLVVHTEVLDHAFDRERRFNITVDIPGEPFWFTSELIANDRSEGTVKLILTRPARVSRCQRRRFWRTAVRRSSAVHIHTADMDPVGRGAMLNVSPDGLACRFDRADADALSTDDEVRLRFSLDGDDYVYAVTGVLKSKTDASDPEQIILRLQFKTEDMPAGVRERLTRATETSRAADSRESS